MIRPISILTACLAASTLSSFAQTPDSAAVNTFAVGASFDINIPSGDKGSWDTGSGATLTEYFTHSFNRSWSATVGLGAYYRTFGTDISAGPSGQIFDTTVKNIGIAIPLLATFSIPVSQAAVFSASTGPELRINLYARRSAMPDFTAAGEPVAPPTANMFHHGFRRAEGVWRIVLGFTFAQKYYVGLDGGVAFTPMAQYGNRDNKIRIRGNTIAIKLSYRF